MNGSLFLIAAKQVLVMFLLVLVGYVAAHVGAVKREARSFLSDLLINIVLPAMIISSYITEYDPAVSLNLLKMFVISMAAMLLGIGIAFLACIRMKGENAQVIRMAMSFGNVGFMGFPLITALFGTEGLLYASMFNSAFNIILWTAGVKMMEKDKSKSLHGLRLVWDVVKKPAFIAVLIGLVIYFCQIPVPDLIAEPLSFLGDMNTPLAMLIVGMVLESGGVKEGVKRPSLWYAMLFRLIVIPAVVLLLCYVFGIGGMVGAVCVIVSACPCASMVSVFAVRYGHDESLGGGTVVISTLFSILTLPVFAGLTSILG